jgi:transcriptional regulator with XRE-family HTH domain
VTALRTAAYARRYRAARAYAGLTQEELANKLGVDEQTIKRRESGKQEPKKAELIAVAALCEVPVEFLEHGWGFAGRDELSGLVEMQNQLLAQQSDVLERISARVEDLEKVSRLDEQTKDASNALPPDAPAPRRARRGTSKDS